MASRYVYRYCMIKHIQGIRTIPGMMCMGIYPETRKDKILRGREYYSMPSYGYLPCVDTNYKCVHTGASDLDGHKAAVWVFTLGGISWA